MSKKLKFEKPTMVAIDKDTLLIGKDITFTKADKDAFIGAFGNDKLDVKRLMYADDEAGHMDKPFDSNAYERMAMLGFDHPEEE